ncbi:MAG: 50S ribosomal protein L28 [Elusimicrobiota bacterium]|nr:50S ribosomal protein L28 [Elusimicrobiota bacterium]
MSFKCAICNKGPKSGRSVSHSKKSTLRVFRPNLHKMRIVLAGKVKNAYVCTRCLRSGKAEKAIL